MNENDREPRPSSPDAEPDDGIDVTLIRWTLSLTPRERLKWLQANADGLTRLRNAAASQR